MKKAIVVGAAVVLAVAAVGTGVWIGLRLFRGHGTGGQEAARASQRDEDAAPPVEPSLSILLNGAPKARTVSGGPLYVTIAVTERHAVNVAAKLEVLRARAGRSAGNVRALEQTKAAIAGLEGRGKLALGEAGRPWAAAVRMTLKPAAGGEAAVWKLRALGAAASAVELDAESSADVEAVPAAPVAVGEYEVRACLGATGSWKGTACSETAQLTVLADSGALTAEEKDALERQAARVALLGEDWKELERIGKGMVGRDKVEGHMALGDAMYGQKEWQKALDHYTAARAALPPRRNGEVPRGLSMRISQLLVMLAGEE
jgi:hypothetical protein